jgi:hypothetical protein
MKPLTKEYIIEKSKPHGMSLNGIGLYKDARQYTETIGEYTLSIVGGCSGLYGDFRNTFEVALIDESTGKFVTGKYSSSTKSDDVLGHATIDEINDLYFNIPRKG